MMKKWSALVAAVLVVSGVVACGDDSSGGGGGGSGGGCSSNGGPNSEDAACNACNKAKCDAPLQKAFGPGYASGSFSGGACATYMGCVTKCGCNDVSCVLGCQPDAACQAAIEETSDCEDTNCASECKTGGNAGSSGAAGNSGGVTVACDMPSSGICQLYKNFPAAGIEQVKSSCTQGGGTVGDDCPTAGLVGKCDSASYASAYYKGEVAELKQSCDAGGGTWSDP